MAKTINKKRESKVKVQNPDEVARNLVYEKIYKKNKKLYSLPFSKYIIHHIDGKNSNNDLKNLYLLSKDDLELVKLYEKTYKKNFSDAYELDVFLDSMHSAPKEKVVKKQEIIKENTKKEVKNKKTKLNINWGKLGRTLVFTVIPILILFLFFKLFTLLRNPVTDFLGATLFMILIFAVPVWLSSLSSKKEAENEDIK